MRFDFAVPSNEREEKLTRVLAHCEPKRIHPRPKTCLVRWMDRKMHSNANILWMQNQKIHLVKCGILGTHVIYKQIEGRTIYTRSEHKPVLACLRRGSMTVICPGLSVAEK